jgi:hypothetical protein
MPKKIMSYPCSSVTRRPNQVTSYPTIRIIYPLCLIRGHLPEVGALYRTACHLGTTQAHVVTILT